ncbi:MAG: tRNA threonylcarbamoyladenosine biosynthesis protein TsaB [Candidatus Azotimanducaceae bacterium]|jgi:tRNA threonylcarbamoyladenosine biosynthesis protein TsaB
MALILCLETATRNCSVALSEDGIVIGEKSHCAIGYSHAEQLHPFILEVLTKAGKKVSDLDAIAVSSGPGSYTGLRIGISAAKGLAYSLDLPLISIPTLQSIAQATVQESWFTKGLICPMIDARRMEVYTCLFDGNSIERTKTDALIIDASSFSEELNNQEIVFIGDGADKCEAVIKHDNAKFIKDFFPEAKYLASPAQKKFVEKQFENLAYFEPYYFKQFQALKSKK